MLTNSIVIVLIIFIITFAICYIISLKSILNFKKQKQIILNFSDYISILDFHMQKAYEMIHKDRILIYSLEATKIPEEQLDTIIKDFINLTKKLLGLTLYNELVKVYGDESTLYILIGEFFNTKYENDEIRKDSINDLMESENDGDLNNDFNR